MSSVFLRVERERKSIFNLTSLSPNPAGRKQSVDVRASMIGYVTGTLAATGHLSAGGKATLSPPATRQLVARPLKKRGKENTEKKRKEALCLPGMMGARRKILSHGD